VSRWCDNATQTKNNFIYEQRRTAEQKNTYILYCTDFLDTRAILFTHSAPTNTSISHACALLPYYLADIICVPRSRTPHNRTTPTAPPKRLLLSIFRFRRTRNERNTSHTRAGPLTTTTLLITQSARRCAGSAQSRWCHPWRRGSCARGGGVRSFPKKTKEQQTQQQKTHVPQARFGKVGDCSPENADEMRGRGRKE
jgi:hypothetical protein